MHNAPTDQSGYSVTRHQHRGSEPDTAIYAVPAFSDNYLWLIAQAGNCLIVDPGDARSVITALGQLALTPCGILVTHKHHDHTGGVDQLIRTYDIPAYAPTGISGCKPTHLVADGEKRHIGKLTFRVIAVPGHTLEHIAWYCEETDPPMLFVGDTLFGGGCGRMFEGTPQQFWQSITTLLALPDSTKIYCAHEYTRANLQFALAIEPNNQNLVKRAAIADSHQQPTVPFTLALEKATNPFCRVDEIAAAKPAWAGLQQHEVFRELRAMKDSF